MQQPSSVDVVIVNYNGADWNAKCLASLLEQGESLGHVIFVDNASTDGSYHQVVQSYGSDPRFIFLPQKHNSLFAAGCNRGIEKALELGAEYIFLLNNDTIVEPECLDALCVFVQSRADMGGVQPLLVRMDDPQKVASAGCRISRMGGAWDHSAGLATDEMPSQPFGVSGITGGACLWKADILRQIGLFDESFGMYFEDVDLSLRARKAGWELYTQPQARVRHMVSASTNKEPSGFCIRLCQANALRLLCKHWPRGWFCVDVLCWFGVSALACLANLRLGKWALSRAIGLGTCDGLRYFRSGLRNRRHENVQRNDALKPWIDREYLTPPAPHD